MPCGAKGATVTGRVSLVPDFISFQSVERLRNIVIHSKKCTRATRGILHLKQVVMIKEGMELRHFRLIHLGKLATLHQNPKRANLTSARAPNIQ